MSPLDWQSILALPPAVRRFERPIPPCVLLREANLTCTQQHGLDKVSDLMLLGVVQESTTCIPATVANDRRVDAVLFLRASLGRTRALESSAALVHGVLSASISSDPGERPRRRQSVGCAHVTPYAGDRTTHRPHGVGLPYRFLAAHGTGEEVPFLACI